MRAALELCVSDPPAPLLAGAKGWDGSVDAAVERARGKGLDVRMLGYLPLEHLSALLGAADIVVYPSFAEGFGLPVLEAMATGAAVLTTQSLSLPEVGGDAVFYTETGVADIASAISQLLAHPSERDAIRPLAHARASTFTWENTARQTLRAYEIAAADGAQHNSRHMAKGGR